MERRIRDRKPVDLPLVCRVPATPFVARMIDVSRTGCRLRIDDAELARGYSVVLELPSGESIGGMVMWRSKDEAGVQFKKPLKTPEAITLGAEEGSPESEVLVSPEPRQAAG